MGDISRSRLIDLPRFYDHRGSLSVIESEQQIPFQIRRVYYLYGTPHGAERGGHGHRELEQLIVAVAGALDVELDDGAHRCVFRLSRPDQGLYVSPMMWRTLRNFESGTVCVVLASQLFDEADYFRDYAEFISAASGS
jgi:dTDP-4-dehydrorhamnose 3,5-epimerase-like enzyme